MSSKERPPKGGELDRPGTVGTRRRQDWIAAQLRRVYDEALQEEIPPDMVELLAQLDKDGPEEPEAPA